MNTFKNNDILMSLDFGEKRIGVAFSYLDLLCPLEYGIINSSKNLIDAAEKTIEYLLEFIKLKKVNILGLIVGLPINMDDTDSKTTKKIRLYADVLKKRFESFESLKTCFIEFEDERLTSEQANEIINHRFSKKKKRESARKIEKNIIAAKIILELYLSRIYGYDKTI